MQDANGDLVSTFTHPWSDGTTGMRLSPLELLEKLAALVPLPHIHLVRYGGVWRLTLPPRRGMTQHRCATPCQSECLSRPNVPWKLDGSTCPHHSPWNALCFTGCFPFLLMRFR
jgi:hypothetical protein